MGQTIKIHCYKTSGGATKVFYIEKPVLKVVELYGEKFCVHIRAEDDGLYGFSHLETGLSIGGRYFETAKEAKEEGVAFVHNVVNKIGENAFKKRIGLSRLPGQPELQKSNKARLKFFLNVGSCVIDWVNYIECGDKIVFFYKDEYWAMDKKTFEEFL